MTTLKKEEITSEIADEIDKLIHEPNRLRIKA
jgi:hypothetical protein